MVNLTSVGVTSGVPSSGTGTVSTIDQMFVAGIPISMGSSAALPAQILQTSSVVTSTMATLAVQVSSLSPPRSIIPASVATVTLSSNPTVIASSAIQVTLTSNTVVLSSNPTVIPSSVATVTLSSNPTITSVSSGLTALSFGANVATIVAGSSAVTSTMSALVVALSTLGPLTVSVTGSSLVSILGGTGGANTANVLAGSSLVTSTMSALVVAISSNGAGVIATGTPTAPSSMYISAVVIGDLGVGGANSSASNPVAIGGVYNSSNPTAVTSGQRTQLWTDKVGRPIVVSALRVLKGVQLTALSCSTTETNITPTSSGGLFLDLYGLVLANQSSLNVQTITIKDSSGGTTRLIFQVPSNDTRGFMLPVDAAVLQAATSQAWTATASNSSGAVQVTAIYVSNA